MRHASVPLRILLILFNTNIQPSEAGKALWSEFQNIWEKAILILAGNLNLGHSYLIKTSVQVVWMDLPIKKGLIFFG